MISNHKIYYVKDKHPTKYKKNISISMIIFMSLFNAILISFIKSVKEHLI